MPGDHSPPPPAAGKAALIIAASTGLIVVAIFVGFKVYRAKNLDERPVTPILATRPRARPIFRVASVPRN
jgi:hypothetical protein